MFHISDNLQEVFNAVCRHLDAQGHRGGIQLDPDPNGFSCLYHAPNGDRCAVGCLIPDDLYDSSMEHQPIDVLRRVYLTCSDEVFSLLDNLQAVHDNIEDWQGIKDELNRVGQRHNLDNSYLHSLAFEPH